MPRPLVGCLGDRPPAPGDAPGNVTDATMLPDWSSSRHQLETVAAAGWGVGLFRLVFCFVGTALWRPLGC